MKPKTLIATLGSWVRQLNTLSQRQLSYGEQHKEAVKDRIYEAVKEHMPSGSGFDCGTKISLEKSAPDKLVFNTEFHHRDENGYYGGWTQHRVTVRPSFDLRMTIHISGPDRNQIKDYMHECFYTALTQQVVWKMSKNKLELEEIMYEQSI